VSVRALSPIAAESRHRGGVLEILVLESEGIPTATSGRGTVAVVAPHRDGHVVGVKPCDPNRRVLVRRLETKDGPVFSSELVTP